MFPSHTFPSTAWSAAPTQGEYHRSYVPWATPQSGSIPQKLHTTVMQQKSLETAMDLEATYSQSGVAPSKQDAYHIWDKASKPWTDVTEPEHHYRLGQQLDKQGPEITQSPCFGDSAAEFKDLVNLQKIEPWAVEPTSLDQRTWSSLPASSREILSDCTGFTDLNTFSSFSSDSYAGFGMTFDEENALPQLFQTGHGSSTSQTESPLSLRTSPGSGSSEHVRCDSASIASYYLSNTQCCSPSDDCCDEFMIPYLNYSIEDTSIVLSNNTTDLTTTNLDSFQLQSLDTPKHRYFSDSLLPSILHRPSLPSNAMARTFSSTGHFDFVHRHDSTEGKCDSKSVDSAEAPNLFRPLQEKQLIPDLEDMKPEEISLAPGEQELRFEGDMYTPKYVRGHGHKREGWCGICKPGRWLVLKNSAFWYDKSFTHGISAASGMAFDGPKETRRMSGTSDVWEGLCGSCDGWIALISSKKKGTTWFRHAYKCHTHQKSKEAPKRRRESNQHRMSKPARTKKAKRSGSSVGKDSSGSCSSTTPDQLDCMLDVSGGGRNMTALQTISGTV